MEYTEVQFDIKPFSTDNSEILTAWLSELPFDSFSETETGFNAYVPTQDFSEQDLKERLEEFSFFQVAYKLEIIADQNWNKVWEENYFEPIVVGDKCLVRGSFHQNTPKTEWEIVIDPKMSFGSGHHSTTRMMLEFLLEIDVENKTLLDMGCGTGILAILAAMRKAKDILAIDIDEWAYNNTIENAENNNQPHIKTLQGGAELLQLQRFDIVLANINTNILVADMKSYKKVLEPNGILIMSGFYSSDVPKIEEKANSLGLKKINMRIDKDWCAIQFQG